MNQEESNFNRESEFVGFIGIFDDCGVFGSYID